MLRTERYMNNTPVWGFLVIGLNEYLRGSAKALELRVRLGGGVLEEGHKLAGFLPSDAWLRRYRCLKVWTPISKNKVTFGVIFGHSGECRSKTIWKNINWCNLGFQGSGGQYCGLSCLFWDNWDAQSHGDSSIALKWC